MDPNDRAEELKRAVVLAVATQASWRAVWTAPAPDLITMLARATCRNGRVPLSNAARIAAGLDNLARGGTWSASSDAANAAKAGDADLFTA